jgi:hypothetical protein
MSRRALLNPSPLKPDELPTIYDTNWRTYTNLTKEQFAAYQALP